MAEGRRLLQVRRMCPHVGSGSVHLVWATPLRSRGAPLTCAVGQHEDCVMSVTNANDTSDAKGEHKFKVRPIPCQMPGEHGSALAAESPMSTRTIRGL